MIWSTAGNLHWKATDRKPFVAEVKIVQVGKVSLAAWRIKGGGVNASGRTSNPIDSMTACQTFLNELAAQEKKAFEGEANTKIEGRA